jgi:hypothetical protein
MRRPGPRRICATDLISQGLALLRGREKCRPVRSPSDFRSTVPAVILRGVSDSSGYGAFLRPGDIAFVIGNESATACAG